MNTILVDWTSVDVCLPERVKPVFVSAGGCVGVAFRSFDHGTWVYSFLEELTNEPITHWAYLPRGVEV